VLDIIEGMRAGAQACLLLVHPDVHRLDEIAHDILSSHDWPHLSVGEELSAALLDEMPERRPLTASRWMKTRIRSLAPGPVLCTGIDLLFEPALSLDPLRLFRDAGRITQVVVIWPGTYQDDVLAYAVPDHAHYCTWRGPDVPIVSVE